MSHGLSLLISYFCLHVLFSSFILTRPMSVEASLVQGWLISPFILLPEILKNLEALSKKNSLVDDLMQTPQTPQLCSAKSKVTLYQPVTSIWRVCSKQNRCRHFQIYCLLQFPCNFGINWKKDCAEILLQQKKTAPTFAPSLRMPAVKRPSQSKSSILITGSHTPIRREVSNRHRRPFPKTGGKFEECVSCAPGEGEDFGEDTIPVKDPLFWKMKEMSKNWQNC